MLYNIDIDYGKENEIIVHNLLNIFFPTEKIKKLGYYDEFDYSNEDSSILCELKSRRCSYNEYNDTMINCSKLNKCKRMSKNKQKKTDVYFFFYFEQSQLYYWKYDEHADIRYSNGGRIDRPNAIKKYGFISRNLLTKVE